MSPEYAQFSSSADNNKAHILKHLRTIFSAPATVLEIGSGSGQHAVYFSKALPHLIWQPTDRSQYLESLKHNLGNFADANVRSPLLLEVSDFPWVMPVSDHIYAANVLHIMSELQVADFFTGVGTITTQGSKLCLYGPYKYKGEFTTPSNEGFNDWLKARDPSSGIRDIEWVAELAAEQGFGLTHDYSMPANNQLLVFER